tara:strand:- start:1 stop:297 length:297 start_codon:yes stop_codon:yes gene_type:complete
MKDLIKDLKVVMVSGLDVEFKDKAIEKLITSYISEKQAFSLQGVVAMLPKIDSSTFKNWLYVNKYAETINRLIYKKQGYEYSLDDLYNLFIEELTLGN